MEAIRFADGLSVSTQALFGIFDNVTHELTAFGQSATAGGWTSNTTYLREMADVNGDGRADIVGFASYGVQVSLASVSVPGRRLRATGTARRIISGIL